MLHEASRQRDVQGVVMVEASSVNKYTNNRGPCAFRIISTAGHETVIGLELWTP